MTPPAMAVANRTVGDVLLESGTITVAQLEEAVARQKQTGQPLGQILVEGGVITRLDLASALAEQWSDAPHLVRMEPGKPGASPFPPFSESVSFDAPVGGAGSEQAIGEIRGYLQVFASRLDGVEGRAGGIEILGERLGELRQMVTGLADWASGPELRIAELESRAAQAGEELTAVSERLDQLISGLDRAITGLEEHAESVGESVEALAARVDAGATAGELAELRALVDELVARPGVDPAAVAELAELVGRAATGTQLDALAARVDTAATRDQLDALTARVDVAAHADQLLELRALVDELGARPVADPALVEHLTSLAARLDDLDTRTAALAAVDVTAGIEQATAGIAARLEALEAEAGAAAARLEGFAPIAAVDGLRDEVVALGARLEEVAAAPAADELRAATDGLRASIDELAARPAVDPGVAERLEALSLRLDALAAASGLEELRAVVDELAARPTAEPERLELLTERVGELTTRLDGLAVSADGKVDANVVSELREALDQLAGRPAGDPELATRLDGLAARVDVALTADDLHELRSAVEELSARIAGDALAATVEGLSGRVEELAARPVVDGGLAARVEELEARPIADPALTARVEELAARLDAVAVSSDGSVDVSVLTELRARVEELAARPAVDPALAGELSVLRDAVEEVAARPLADAAIAEDVAALRLEIAALGAVDSGGVDALATRLAQLERQAATLVGGPEPADVARLSGRIEELAARIEAVALEAGSGPSTTPGIEAPATEVDKLRVSVESLWMRMAEFQKSVAALLDPRGIAGKLERIEARLEALEAGGGAARHTASAATSDAGLSDLREIARRIEDMESASSTARDTLLTSLERMASSIDWRLQRLEKTEA